MSAIRSYADIDLRGSAIFGAEQSSFPSSPVNGQTTFINGVLWIYSTVQGVQTWYPLNNQKLSYVFTQGAANTTWTVTHNMGSTDFILGCYDANSNFMYPTSLTNVTANSFQVNFTEAVTGMLVAFFDLQNDGSPGVGTTVDASTLTGTTLASNVVNSSLTSVGTLGSLTVTNGVSAGTFSGSGASLTSLNASNISSGTVAPARLGTGTASSSTFLRGDGTWATVSGGSGTPGGSNTQVQYNASGSFAGSSSFTFNSSTGVVSATGFSGSGASLTSLTAANLNGVVPVANLGTGTASSSTYLRGDGTWSTVTATTATNLSGGGAGQLAYQSAAGATTFLSAGTASQVLVGGASAPAWSSAPAISGANITSLNASNLTTGSVPSGALGTGTASNATYLRGDGVWSALVGSGAQLTALNASNISSGTVGTSYLGSGTASSSTYLRGDGTWAAVVTTVLNGTGSPTRTSSVSGVYAGVYSGLPELFFTNSSSATADQHIWSQVVDGSGNWVMRAEADASSGAIIIQATRSGANVSNFAINSPAITLNGAVSGTSFSGSGSGLTSLTAANISGVIPTANLGTGTASSSTYLRGDGTWAAITGGTPGGSTTQVQYNASGAFAGSSSFTFNSSTGTVSATTFSGAHTGDGSALTNLNASNLASGTVASGRLGTGTASNATYLRGDGVWSALVGSGAQITALNASNISSGIVGTAYLGTGTASTTTFLRGDGTWATPTTVASVLNGTVQTSRTSATSGTYAGIDQFGQPVVSMTESGLGTNAKAWTLYVSTGSTLKWDLSADDFSTATNWLTVSRTGMTVGTIAFGGAVTATSFAGSGTGLTALNASNISSGTVGTSYLGTGTASSSTFLRGDGTWAAVTASAAGSDTQVQYNSSGSVSASANFTFSSSTGVVSATGFSGSGSALTALNGSNISSGTVGTAYLGSGTANNTTFLRGDGTWTVPTVSVTSVNATGTVSPTVTTNSVSIGVGPNNTYPSMWLINGTANSGQHAAAWQSSGSGGDISLALYNDTLNTGANVITVNRSANTATNITLTSTAITLTGAVSGTSFSGNGAGLTSLTASNLSGVVPVANLGTGTASSSTYLRGDGTWATVAAAPGGSSTQVQYNNGGAFAGSASFTFNSSTGVVSATGFAGSGASLTSLNASNISSGTVPTGNLGTGTASSSTYLRGDGTWAAVTASTATNISGGVAGNVHYQSAASTTAFVTNAAGVLQAASSGAVPAWTTTPTLTGTNITGLPAANLSGVVPTANLGTGTASTTTFLRGDGTWASPAGSSPTSINATANFTATITTNQVAIGLMPSTTYSGVAWINGTAGSGTRMSAIYSSGASGTMTWAFYSDDESTNTAFLTINRSGNAATNFTVASQQFQFNGVSSGATSGGATTNITAAPGGSTSGGGGTLTLVAGSATSGTGGAATLTGGASASGTGGGLTIGGGNSSSGTGGAVTINGGTSGNGASNNGGTINITAGAASSASSGSGGNIVLTAGTCGGGTTGSTGTTFTLAGGTVGSSASANTSTLQGGSGVGTGSGGTLTIQGGTGNGGTGGTVNITGGNAAGSSGGSGGPISITSGAVSLSTGSSGAITMSTPNGGSSSGASGAITINTGGTNGGTTPGAVSIYTGSTTGTAATVTLRVNGSGGNGVQLTSAAFLATSSTLTLGTSSNPWGQIYSTQTTILTSDRNYKTDIEDLDEAELRVAKRLKSLIKKFRFKDAVAKKGDEARIHIGVIAQEVEAAFMAEGLDAARYGIWCNDVWYELDGQVVSPETKGAVKVTKQGIRHDQLYGFIIAAM